MALGVECHIGKGLLLDNVQSGTSLVRIGVVEIACLVGIYWCEELLFF